MYFIDIYDAEYVLSSPHCLQNTKRGICK